MKTTTTIIISLALATLLLIEGVVIIACLNMKPGDSFHIESSAESVTQPVKPFSSVEFVFDSQTFLSSVGDGFFTVQQSDSVTSPYIELPANFTNKMKVWSENGTLKVSFYPRPHSEAFAYGNVIVLNRPITIFTPVMPDTIVNGFENFIVVKGNADKRLFIASRGNVQFIDSRLSSVLLTDGKSANGNFLENSFIDDMTVENFTGSLYFNSDSVSSIECLTVKGLPNNCFNFSPNRLRIDNFTFIPADSSSTISINDNSKITLSFN